MRSLERELRSALRRRAAPPGLTKSVLLQIKASEWETSYKRRRTFIRSRVVRWAAASVSLLLAVIGFELFHREQQRRIEEQRADRQATVALQITRSELSVVLGRAQSVVARVVTVPTNLKDGRGRQ